MKTLILVAFVAMVLAVGTSNAGADVLAYRPPAHNYYQNNWMSG